MGAVLGPLGFLVLLVMHRDDLHRSRPHLAGSGSRSGLRPQTLVLIAVDGSAVSTRVVEYVTDHFGAILGEVAVLTVQSVWFTPRTDGSIWLNGWDPLQIMAFTAASNATELDDWWGGGSAPMLILQGLQDRIAPPSNGRDLRNSYPDRVSLIELRGTAHALLPEEPDLIASAIIQFLEAIDRERELAEGGQV